MTSLLNVCLYSGISHLDPQLTLNEEQTLALKEKIFALKEKPRKAPFPRLGKTISVKFDEEEPVYILSYPEYPDLNMPAAVLVYWKSQEEAEPFVDTENIAEYLAELAAPALEKHYEDMKEMWMKHEKVPGVT